MEFITVTIENPENLNFILGQAHFIKTVEDIHETMVQSVPGIAFGIAFCEASGPRLVRISGTDPDLIDLAAENAMRIGAGHSFIIFMKDVFPVNVLPGLKRVAEVCRIFCATANPAQVLIAETDQGRGILGVVDGMAPLGVEKEDDIRKRKDFLRTIGYKIA